MTNLLEAIHTIVNKPERDLTAIYNGHNRMNGMGHALEDYIKNCFANSFENSPEEIKQIHNDKFSWLGNQNNIPDLIIKGGDALEIKKLQSVTGQLQLNSSYPKSTLRSNNPKIAPGCRACEEWEEKDLIYTIGYTSGTQLRSLWMVYGNLYAASHEVYEKISQTIEKGINSIEQVEFQETREFGRVNRVDPLGITTLRIRGMWLLANPKTAFNYLTIPNFNNFQLVCLIPLEKYNSFPVESINKLKGIEKEGFNITNTTIKDPNNPAKLLNAKLITFSD